MRTFFIFAHNQPVHNLHLHPLVIKLKSIKSKQELLDLEQSNTDPLLIPKALPVNFAELGIQSLQGIDLVEFNHGFYQEHFRDMGLSNITKSMLSLRLCAFVDLGT